MRQSARANTTCAHAPRTLKPVTERALRYPVFSHTHPSSGGNLPSSRLANYFIAMLVNKVIQFVLAAAVVWRESDAGTSHAVKLCGRQLSEIMSKVCHAYNSPSWDVPTVVEQPGTVARRKRQLGIVDECCVIGCTWEQLSEYCSISAYSESPFEDLETHNIADRSAEVGAKSTKPEPPVSQAAPPVPAQMKERERRREELVKNVRAAPVVGTVSPLITWGRTLNTDLHVNAERDRYAYVVYA